MVLLEFSIIILHRLQYYRWCKFTGATSTQAHTPKMDLAYFIKLTCKPNVDPFKFNSGNVVTKI